MYRWRAPFVIPPLWGCGAHEPERGNGRWTGERWWSGWRACDRRSSGKCEVRLGALETTFALALWDVCGALGLTEEERAEVLGASELLPVSVRC